ncbi:MAG: hypothetical protein CVV27_05075 [Candidatus Melainabacteria bacterium HGW-Melainabacteria-1]|nr:MAG: hypothetical protein CVV27_05075 [Candidatus Melainabacteria bacterium HGW-Melainabacteria-1]
MSELSDRPILKLPLSRLEIGCEVFGLAGLLLALGLFLVYWPILPESIPTHFNLAGEADDWGPKGVFAIFPAMALILFAVITAINRFPWIFNYFWEIHEGNAERQYRLARALLSWLKACSMWLFVALAWMTARTALGAQDNSLPNTLLMLMGAAMLLSLAGYFIIGSKAR